jgi:hypothetical protein
MSVKVKVSDELERTLGNILQRHGDEITVVKPMPLSGEMYGVELLAPDKKTIRRWVIMEIASADGRWVMLIPEGGILPAHLQKIEAPGLVKEGIKMSSDPSIVLNMIVKACREAGFNPKEIRLDRRLFADWLKSYGGSRSLTTDVATYVHEGGIASGIVVKRSGGAILIATS